MARYLGEIALTRRTFAAGAWTLGKFVKGAATDTTIRGAWRPMQAKEAQLLESGDRARDPRVLITETELTIVQQGADVTSDYISPDGGTTFYEVLSKQDGSDATAALMPGVNAFRYTLLRLDEVDG